MLLLPALSRQFNVALFPAEKAEADKSRSTGARAAVKN
jgi:hypothetical protein